MNLIKKITVLTLAIIFSNVRAQVITPNTSAIITTFKSGAGSNINIPAPNNPSTIAKASQAGLIVPTYDANVPLAYKTVIDELVKI